jgi:uncharacterized protein (DUF849 family)
VPSGPVGITTIASTQPDPDHRLRTCAAWNVLPAFCSVNIRETGSIELATLLRARGIGVEAGLNEAAHVRTLVDSGLAPGCLRLLLEPHGASLAHSLRLANEMAAALDAAGIGVRRLLHGTGETAWSLMDIAIARGYDIRVGIEDMLTLPNDTMPATNGTLVSEAVRRVGAVCSAAAS